MNSEDIEKKFIEEDDFTLEAGSHKYEINFKGTTLNFGSTINLEVI